MVCSDDELRKAFDEIDKDGDKTITKEEMFKFLDRVLNNNDIRFQLLDNNLKNDK